MFCAYVAQNKVDKIKNYNNFALFFAFSLIFIELSEKICITILCEQIKMTNETNNHKLRPYCLSDTWL